VSETDPTTPRPERLTIEAALTLSTAQGTINIHTADSTLFVDADSLGVLRALYETTQGAMAAHSTEIPALDAVFDDGPIAVKFPIVVRVQGVPIARSTPEEPAGRIASLLGIAPFAPDPVGLARTVGGQLVSTLRNRLRTRSD